MRFSRLILMLACLTVTGCASTGATIQSMPSTLPAPGKARIVVERASDFMYLALSARVYVNGQQIATLYRGDAAMTEVDPGQVTVTADTLTAPGRFSVSMNAAPDAEYRFEISPRGDSFAPGAAFGLLGLAADASINEQSGLFQVRDTGAKSFGSAISVAPTSAPVTGATPTDRKADGVITAPSTSSSSAKNRLSQLKKLFEAGLITQQDYERKKADILKSL